MQTFFQKLGGRDVTRVAAAYLAVAWLAIEVVVTVSEPLGIPGWFGRAAIISALAGFPIALILAWTYRLTPEGRIERETNSRTVAPARLGGRQIDFVIIGALALALVFLLVNARFGAGGPDRVSVDGNPVVTSVRKLTNSPIYLPPYSSVFPLVVDDSRVYFDHFDDGLNRIGQVSRSGGEVLAFDDRFNDPNIVTVLDRLSPDESALVLNVFDNSRPANEPEIWEVPIVAGSPRKIGDGYQSAISPDGTRMIFRRGWTDLYLANADMTDARKVFTADAMSLYWLRFSPDGKRVRFTLFIDHFAGSIWEYSLELDEAYPIMPNWNAGYACCGSWTPDGKYYVFEAMHEAGPQIWAIRNMPDGRPHPDGPFLLSSSVMDFKRPALSEDGKTIYAIGWQLRGEVVEKWPGDDSFRPITGLRSMSVEQVDFSRDGEWAAFVSYPDGHLWKKHFADEFASQLTFGSMRVANPQISPDGRMIAFEGWNPGDQKKKIFIIPRDGGDADIVSDREVSAWDPSWSPDGTKLLFSEKSEVSPVIFDLLTGTASTYGGAVPIYSAQWAPDGSKFLGRSNKDLVVYDFEEEELDTIIEDAPFYNCYWSSDSRHVYLVDSWIKRRDRAIFRLNIHDKKMEKILRVGSERIAWGTDARWVGVRPEGVAMFMRDHSIHNIYALEWNPD